MITTAREKMSKARTTLVMDFPFWGALSLRSDLIEDATCKTAYTDGVNIGYNPTWILGLTFAECVGLVAHEVAHIALGHNFRRDGRDPYFWNVACDFALNAELILAGFTLPEGALLNDDYSGRSAEWIFARVAEQDDEDGAGSDDDDGDQDSDDGDQDSDDGDGPSGDDGDQDSDDDGEQGDEDSDEDSDGQSADNELPEGADEDSDQPKRPAKFGEVGEVRDAPSDLDREDLENEIKKAVTQARMVADKFDGLDAASTRLAKHATESKADWRNELRRFADQVAAVDYDWATCDRRFSEDDFHIPELGAKGMGHLVTVVDTSGSVDDVTLSQYAKEVGEIFEETDAESITVIYADYAVQAVDRFSRGEEITLAPKGGGWTDFRPAFEWVEANATDRPAALIYLTDLEPCGGGFPEHAPDYPVLWVATGYRTRAPFGEVIRLDT